MATAVVAAVQMPSGVDLGSAVWQTLAQSPVLFFGGFMLTEPLPPRRWQQLAMAAAVGILLAMPYNFGLVANSPELALLICNLLAFLAGQRGSVRLLFSHSRSLTPTTTEFVFRPQRPLRHAPGQCLELDLPHTKPDGRGRRRVFSHPESKQVKIGVGTADPVSAARRKLLSLKPGEPTPAVSTWIRSRDTKGEVPFSFPAHLPAKL